MLCWWTLTQGRLLCPWMDTWTIHLLQHGILMVSLLPLVTKTTCRIWDVRNLSESVAVLKGNLGAMQSIRYTSDGRYMAMAEPAAFVHLYDVKSGQENEQEIDFFGEISGLSFSPDTVSLHWCMGSYIW